MIDLRSEYECNFSFNDELLSKCFISNKAEFNSLDDAIHNLCSKCSLSVDKLNGVYLITKKEVTSQIEKPNYYYFNGRVTDKESTESLPFSNIMIEGNIISSNENGGFSYKSKNKRAVIKVSHLGFNLLDTIIDAGNNINLYLEMKMNSLSEIVVTADTVQTTSIDFVKKPSTIKLNVQEASPVPGNNNNLLFNVLRLQPGVLASGEQTKEFVIWGSYIGQSQLIFDGITLFNLSSYNENIGIINPLMIKDIEVYKAGYNVEIGDRVGGIVHLTSKDGNRDKTAGSISINNQTIGGLFSMPIKKKSSLQAGFRKTILNKPKNREGVFFKPNHEYTDYNLKYSSYSDNGDKFSISALASNDFLQQNLKTKIKKKINISIKENMQNGISGYYERKWKEIGISNLTISTSSFASSQSLITHFDEDSIQFKANNFNRISESTIKLNHLFPSTLRHRPSLGIEFSNYKNDLIFSSDTIKDNSNSTREYSNLASIYIKDEIQIFPKIQLAPGVKFNYVIDGTIYTEPRVELCYNPFEKIKIKLSSGYYNQFISQIPITVDDRSSYYHWSISDNVRAPLLSAIHNVGGISYDYKGISMNLDVFQKSLYNLTQYRLNSSNNLFTYQIGSANIYGFDTYLKKRFKKVELWGNYTFNQIFETFENIENDAPHHQNHEIKMSGVLNIKSFYLSSSLVIGSGFPDKKSTPYNRLDISGVYKFRIKEIKAETGTSVLNVTKESNYKLNNFIYTTNTYFTQEATPLSLNLFFTINF